MAEFRRPFFNGDNGEEMDTLIGGGGSGSLDVISKAPEPREQPPDTSEPEPTQIAPPPPSPVPPPPEPEPEPIPEPIIEPAEPMPIAPPSPAEPEPPEVLPPPIPEEQPPEPEVEVEAGANGDVSVTTSEQGQIVTERIRITDGPAFFQPAPSQARSVATAPAKGKIPSWAVALIVVGIVVLGLGIAAAVRPKTGGR